MRHRYVLLGIISVAVAVRLILFFTINDDRPGAFVLGDTRGYMQIADNLLAGNGYSMATTSPYLPDSIRTPVLPYTLAAVKGIFGSAVPYVILQIIMAAALVFLTYKIALLVTGNNERLALVVAALMAFEPYAIFINTSLLTETLFMLFITAGAYAALLYARDHKLLPLAVASGLFALAALTRPIAQFMPLLLAALVLYVESPASAAKATAGRPACRTGRPRAYAKYLVAAIIPFFLVASPWLVRNYDAFGIVAFSSGGLQNVYSDLGATILSYRDGGEWRQIKQNLEADFAARHDIPVSTIQQNLDLSPLLFREGLLLMINNPGATVTSFLSVALAFFTNDAWSYYLQHWGWMQPFTYGFSPTSSLFSDGPFVTFGRVIAASGPGLWVAIVGRAFWVVTSILFFVGAWVLLREKGARVYALVIMFSVLYYLGLSWSAGAGVNGRYRYPLDPLIFTAACVGASALASRIGYMIGWKKLV